MRVLTFLHSFEPGGVERIALRLVRQWRTLGADAPLYLGRLEGAMSDDVGRELDILPAGRPRFDTARWETLWMILALPGVIRRERPDVLFCAGNTYGIVAVAMKLLLGRRCPPILAKVSNDLDRGDKPWFGRFSYRMWLRILGRHLDHVVGMEEPARAEIAERLGIRDDRITIIPDPALSLATIAMARAPRGGRRHGREGRRFVAVGRLVPQKNIALMLRAFQRGAQPDDHLTVIGDGPERPRLEALAARLGIADRVTFRGYIASPVLVLHEYDVLLLSSNYEGVPAVILEALAANLAIVATECSRSMSALLKQQRLGDLVPVGNEAAFASAIARARPGSNCARLSRSQAERFTLEHAAELYLAAFCRTQHCPGSPQEPPARLASTKLPAFARATKRQN